jgi:hypothetical protein
MRRISQTVWETNEIHLLTHYWVGFSLDKSKESKTSTVTITTLRLIIKSENEIIEVSLTEINSIQIANSIWVYNLDLRLASGESIYFACLRPHLRGCEIYAAICSMAICSIWNYEGAIVATSFIKDLKHNIIAPEDLSSSSNAMQHWCSMLSKFGIYLVGGNSPRLDYARLDMFAKEFTEKEITILSAIPDGSPVKKGEIVFEYEWFGMPPTNRPEERRGTCMSYADGYARYLPGEKSLVGKRYNINEQLLEITKQLPIHESRSSKYPRSRTESTEFPKESDERTDGLGTILVDSSDYIKEINNLVGQRKVKQEIQSIHNLALIENERIKRLGLSNTTTSRHLVFLGAPGTGKTTVARILGRMYKSLGVLSKGHFVETDRSGLVAGYLGQTALKTNEVIESALGGVLFIDEAYSLAPESQDLFGREAIDTLLGKMENHREDLVVIVAGYPEPMNRFLESNPGLKSRFNAFLYFEDYTESELLDIFLQMASSRHFRLTDEAKEKLINILSLVSEMKGDGFANARSIRNLLESTIRRQAGRLVSLAGRSDKDLVTIEKEDLSTEDVRSITN